MPNNEPRGEGRRRLSSDEREAKEEQPKSVHALHWERGRPRPQSFASLN